MFQHYKTKHCRYTFSCGKCSECTDLYGVVGRFDMYSTKEVSKKIRQYVFKMAYKAGGAHMGAAFSEADIISELYFGNILRYDSRNPKMANRDRFILSKGHGCFSQYAALALAGFFSEDELWRAGTPGSMLGGHPRIYEIPGIEASTGALGHGLSFGIGIAYACKADKINNHVYVMLGDGECQEGSVWEGALSAPTLGLDNLTVIIDHNKLQAMDMLENIVKMSPFADKWRAFGWNILDIDGHDHEEIHNALLERKNGVPTAIIANTVKGKGVSFMEDVPIWHYRMPNDEEMECLMQELDIAKDWLKDI